jgi:hypothetical protein
LSAANPFGQREQKGPCLCSDGKAYNYRRQGWQSFGGCGVTFVSLEAFRAHLKTCPGVPSFHQDARSTPRISTLRAVA